MPWDPAFDEFATLRTPSLLRTATFLTGDRHAAEDLLQTALVRTALRWRRARDNPDAYIRQVLVNLTRDRWRASLRRVPEIPLEPAASDSDALVTDYLIAPQAVSAETTLADRDALLSALRNLPARQRTAVVLRFWEDMSVAETAVYMRCSEGTVKSAASRGLAALRVALTTQYPDPPGPISPGSPATYTRRR